MYKKPDLTMVLNGALAGLVSITAEPLAPTLFGALWIGAVGGVIVVLTVPMLDKFKIDDVVGAIPVHLLAGIWGTIAVVFYGSADIVTQLTGIAAYGVFTFVGSLILWFIIKAVMGLRVDEETEISGLDMSEMGMEAYPGVLQELSSLLGRTTTPGVRARGFFMSQGWRVAARGGGLFGCGRIACIGPRSSMTGRSWRRRSAFVTTKTDDSAIAPAASIGDRSIPNAG